MALLLVSSNRLTSVIQYTIRSACLVGAFLHLSGLVAVQAAQEPSRPSELAQPELVELTELAEETVVERLERHIGFLASDELKGRGNGTPDLDRAADYIAKTFDLYGLEPAGVRGEYFQEFSLTKDTKLGSENAISFAWNDTERTLALSTDFEPLTFSAAGRFNAPLAFAGYGITAPDAGYDDYADVDVDGKIVVVLRFVPGRSQPNPPFAPDGYHATFVAKALNAKEHGAVALLMVTGPLHKRADRLVSFGANVGAEELSIGAAHVRRDYVEELLRSEGRSLRELQDRIESDFEPQSFEFSNVDVSLRFDVERSRVGVKNVAGYLPPAGESGPERSYSSYLVVGAHYDHLGLGGRGSRARGAKGHIHNGADDNASGVAALLELARRFSMEHDRRRGILFVGFAGEELGLLGSRSFVEAPPLPLGGAVAMVNLDMIGRLRHERIFVGGLDSSPSFDALMRRLAGDAGLEVQPVFSADRASDHASFIDAGIPSLFFFTGLHGDYHKPTDDPQFVDYTGVKRVVDLVHETAENLLGSEDVPRFAERVARSSVEQSVRWGSSRPAPWRKPYFGVTVERGFEGRGLLISEVPSFGPAAKAGIRPGDVLMDIDGTQIKSVEEVSRLLLRRRPGDAITAQVQRDGAVMEVKVKLASWP